MTSEEQRGNTSSQGNDVDINEEMIATIQKYYSMERDILCSRNRVMDQKLASAKIQFDHMKHAYKISYDYLILRVDAFPSLVPGGSVVERKDIKSFIQATRDDLVQNIINIERFFGDE